MRKQFCATLDQDPWGKQYRAIRIKVTRKTPLDGLRKDRVEKVLEDLFVTILVKQEGDPDRFRISQMHEVEGYDLRITEDDLLTAMEKCDPRKAADVDGIPGEIVKIITELAQYYKQVRTNSGDLEGGESGTFAKTGKGSATFVIL
jgi:hypothetical protein